MKPSASLFVFDMSIGFREFLRRDAIFLAGPPSQIDQFAALTAKRSVFVDGLFITCLSLHRKPAADSTDYRDSEKLADKVVFQRLGNFYVVKMTHPRFTVTGI